MLVIMIPLGAQVRLLPPPPGHTDVFTLPRTYRCTEACVNASGKSSAVLKPKARAETCGEAAGSSASLFSSQFFMNELRPKGVYFFMNGSPKSE